MKLPHVPLPTDFVEIADEKIEVRGLSYAMTLRMNEIQDPEYLGVFIVARAVDIPEDEARQWIENTPPEVADIIVDKCLKLTKVSEEDNFQDNSPSDTTQGS